MKTFTRFAAVFLTAAILFGLAGCKKDAETKPEPEAVYYTVSFDTDGAGDIASQKVEEGKVATKPEDPAKTGYSFGGWYNGETAFDFATAITSDVTLKAKWTLLTFTVTFDTDGGSEAPATQTIGYGSKVTKPENPTKEGFSSFDWMNGNVIYDFDTPVTSNLLLKVKWYIGIKTPSSAKEICDIVFSDGSAIPYSTDLALSSDQKSKAIAVIFCVGLECSDDDNNRTLGIGLDQASKKKWCTDTANAYSINISTIQNNKDGSRNFEKIAQFSGVSDTNEEANYPAFYFAINYESQSRSHVSGTDYETGWYLPSVTELETIHSNKNIIQQAILKCDGLFYSGSYWSSSQWTDDETKAIHLVISNSSNGGYGVNYKNTETDKYVCAIREF